ncbi:MAG TPA: type VII secretion target [Jatrophihabitantaceae bacterium]
MTGGGFNVDTEELNTQAEAIRGIVEGIRQARSASDEEGVGGLVYGILFDPTMLPGLSQAKDIYAEAITNCAEIGEGIVKGLQTNIKTYQGVEEDITKALNKLKAQGG